MAFHQGELVTDVYEILRQKELACARLRQEVAALRVAAGLLDPQGAVLPAGEEGETLDEMIARERAMADPATLATVFEQTVTEGAPPSAENAEGERKGPATTDPSQTSWWRRLSGT